MSAVDILVVGAGMAGISAAAELARGADVLLIEQEEQATYHATGRSAALLSHNYGSRTVRALTRLSRRFLDTAATDFSSDRLLSPRGILQIAKPEQMEALQLAGSDRDLSEIIVRLSGEDARRLVPILRAEVVGGALLDLQGADIDVHALASAYLRLLKKRGGVLDTGRRLLSLRPSRTGWTAQTTAGPCSARLVVNAAGAWAESVGRMAGCGELELLPLRRTAILVDGPAEMTFSNWPMTVNLDETFFFKPEAGRLMVSPCDTSLSPPCDAQAEEWDVAMAVSRLEDATTLMVKRVHSKWAALRTFAPDENPVIGFDPKVADFFWLAGQGGFGIQTAPAVAQAVAGLILAGRLPGELADAGIAHADIGPARLSKRGRHFAARAGS